jgi:hypothetical protein
MSPVTLERYILDPLSENAGNSPLELTGRDASQQIYFQSVAFPEPEQTNTRATGRDVEGDLPVGEPTHRNRVIPFTVLLDEYKGVGLPATVTNLLTNPSFETNATGWTSGNGTIARDTTTASRGGASGLVTVGTGGSAFNTLSAISAPAINPDTPYSFRAAFRVPNAGTYMVQVGDGSHSTTSGAVVLAANEWTWVTIENITGLTGGGAFNVTLTKLASGATFAAGETWWIDTAMLVQGTTIQSDYVDGDQPGCVWTGTVGASSSQKRADVNLVTNPSFELNTTPWSNNSVAASDSFTRSTSWAKASEYSLYAKWHGTGANQFATAMYDGSTGGVMPITGGTAYLLRAHVNVVQMPAASLDLEVIWRGPTGTAIGSTTVAASTSATGEQIISGPVIAPPAACFAQLLIGWNVNGGLNNGEVAELYIDDVVLMAVPATGYSTRRNLVPNPSFEVNVTTGWDNSGTPTRDTSWSQFGAASMRKVQSATSNDVSIFQAPPYVAIAPGDIVTVSAYYKIGSGATNTGAGNGPRLIVDFDNGSGTFALGNFATPNIPAPAVGATGRLSLTLPAAPAGATRFRIRMLCGVTTGTQTVDVLWDGVLAEKAGSAGTYFDGSGYDDGAGHFIASATSDHVFGWDGAAGTSTSVLRVGVLGVTSDYFDGDVAGCTWRSTAHGSASERVGTGDDRKRFEKAFYHLEMKLQKLMREGGTLKRYLPDGTYLVFDVVGAKQTGDNWGRPFNQGVQPVQFELEALPYARLAPITLTAHQETVSPALIFTETGAIPGDVSALGKLTITDIEGGAGRNRKGVRVGGRMKHYDPQAGSLLKIESDYLPTLGPGASYQSPGGSPAGPSGGISVLSGNLATAPVSTVIVSGVLLHVGTYRVFARCAPAGVGAALVQLLLKWAPRGQNLHVNPAVTIDAGGATGWHLLDLGLIDIPDFPADLGSQGWTCSVNGQMASAGTGQAYLDCLLFVPTEFGYTECDVA